MLEKKRSDLIKCLALILRPIARYCTRHSLYIQDLIEAAKVAFVEVAREDLTKRGDTLSVLKLSTYTGMHRRDVTRIFSREEIKDSPQSAVSRVIGAWQGSQRFRSKAGTTRALSIDGPTSDFSRLVESVTKEFPPNTILFELERLGAVKRTRKGLKLIRRAYVPTGNLRAAFSLLQRDLNDLILSVEGNLYGKDSEYNLHANTFYDRIPASSIPMIRNWLVREGSAFHQKVRNFLSRYDADINHEVEVGKEPMRVSLGSFSVVTTPDGGGLPS